MHVCMYNTCMSVYCMCMLHVYLVTGRLEEGTESPGMEIIGGCELTCGC